MRKKYFYFVAILVLCLTIVTTYSYLSMKNITEETLSNQYNMDIDNQTVVNSINSSQLQNKIEQIQQEYENPDIKALLTIENSNFIYPVVQTSDNNYYLNHDYKKEYNSLGSIYADYRVNLEGGRKILIFGHSSKKTETPFNQLEKYYDENYYKNHKYITIETKNNIYHYEIFSVYVETNDFTYMNLKFETQQDWYLHILKLQQKSLYPTNIKLNPNDDILIMQTCSTHSNYKKNSKKYLLIISRRVNDE